MRHDAGPVSVDMMRLIQAPQATSYEAGGTGGRIAEPGAVPCIRRFNSATVETFRDVLLMQFGGGDN